LFDLDDFSNYMISTVFLMLYEGESD